MNPRSNVQPNQGTSLSSRRVTDHRSSNRRFQPYVFSAVMLTLTFFAHGATGQSCSPLTPTSALPSAANPGDSFSLSGTGFCGPVTNFFSWAWDGASGVVLPLANNTPTALNGSVGQSEFALTGVTEAWRGTTVGLPPLVIYQPGGTYSVFDRKVFLAEEIAYGPVFSLLSSSADTESSTLQQGQLVIDLAPPTLLTMGPLSVIADRFEFTTWCACDWINVQTVVRIQGPPGGGDTPREGGTEGIQAPTSTGAPTVALAASLKIKIFGNTAPCTASLTNDLTATLQQALGNLGLTAQAGAQSITLSHASGAITAGTLSLERH